MVTYPGAVDEVFKALADPTRRSLLDELFREDGQTLGALEARFDMTRFGVMKHLKLLEEAGLVVTKRRGREKLHFLNPVPIRLVHDRWVSKYAEPWAAGAQRPQATTGADRWRRSSRSTSARRPSACGRRSPTPRSGPSTTSAPAIDSDWTPGSRFEMSAARTATYLLGEGENLEVDPPRRLVQTMVALWSDDVKAEGTSRDHVGDRADRRLVPAHASRTTRCAKARTTSSTAAGR